jgi:WD40 repeat protein
MARSSWCDDREPVFGDHAGSSPFGRHPVRLAIVSLLRAAFLFALVMTFVGFICEQAPTNEEPPAWSIHTGHSNGVLAAAFSADGSRLATGGNDGCIVVWEVGNGVEKELSYHPRGRVLRVAFSPDGMTIASAHDDFTIVLWDVTTGTERATLTGHTDRTMCLDFSPDGAILATGGGDQSIRLWDVTSGRHHGTLNGQAGPVCSLRFCPDGRTLAAGRVPGLVELWDVPEGKCRKSLVSSLRGYPIHTLAVSPDGLTLASAGTCDNLKFWDVKTGQERVSSRTEDRGSRNIVFSAYGAKLIVADFNGNVRLMDLSARSEQTFRLGIFNTYCSAFSPGGASIALGDMDGTLRIWHLTRADCTTRSGYGAN